MYRCFLVTLSHGSLVPSDFRSSTQVFPKMTDSIRRSESYRELLHPAVSSATTNFYIRRPELTVVQSLPKRKRTRREFSPEKNRSLSSERTVSSTRATQDSRILLSSLGEIDPRVFCVRKLDYEARVYKFRSAYRNPDFEFGFVSAATGRGCPPWTRIMLAPAYLIRHNSRKNRLEVSPSISRPRSLNGARRTSALLRLRVGSLMYGDTFRIWPDRCHPGSVGLRGLPFSSDQQIRFVRDHLSPVVTHPLVSLHLAAMFSLFSSTNPAISSGGISTGRETGHSKELRGGPIQNAPLCIFSFFHTVSRHLRAARVHGGGRSSVDPMDAHRLAFVTSYSRMCRDGIPKISPCVVSIVAVPSIHLRP